MASLTRRLMGWVLPCAVLVLCAPAAALAQSSRQARIVVTVVDSTGGVLQNATVSVIGLESATKAVAVKPAKTDDKGQVTFENVAPGRYSLQAEFTGFELGLLRDVRV